MNRVDHLLVVLSEECAEVVQETSKCLRFGIRQVYAEKIFSNIERVTREFNDAYAMMEMLADEGIIEKDFIKREWVDIKKCKVGNYMRFSKKMGKLDDPRVQQL